MGYPPFFIYVKILIMALLLTFILGLFFVAGIIIIRLSKSQLVEHISISLALGAMLALLCFDLLPEIIEVYGNSSNWWKATLLVLLGVVILKALDTFVPEHEAHDEHSDESMAHIGTMSAVAISLHNILEGMTVYNIAKLDFSAGLSLGVGVGLHNIPMGMLIYATLSHEKSVKKYGIIIMSVVSTFIGGCLMAGLSPFLSETILAAFVCITVGMVLFIVLFEIIPSLIRDPRKGVSLICVFLGAALVYLSAFFE